MNKLIPLFSLLVACAPTPASIDLAASGPALVHEITPVKLPTATVKDAEGKAIEGAPAVTWSSSDAAVASVDPVSGQITPVGDGTAEIVATLGEIHSAWSFSVALPDSVQLTGATEGQSLPIGATVQLVGAVMDGDQPLADIPVTWHSSDVAVATVVDGLVTGLAEGEVHLTAMGGGQTAGLDIVVSGAAMADATAP